MEGARFLDLYAGSGAVGLEALSRGAAEVVFVERAPEALKTLRGNLTTLNVRAGFQIQPGGVTAYLRKARGAARGFDLVFMDPPYDAAEEYASALGLLGGEAAAMLGEGAMVVAEHRRKEKLGDAYGRLRRTRLLEQGDAALSFYAVGSARTTEQAEAGGLD